MAVGEGLFPPTVNTLINHELVHLVAEISYFGPPREIWEFKQEQLVNQIKKSKINKGGKSIEITAVKLYMSREIGNRVVYRNEEYNNDVELIN